MALLALSTLATESSLRTSSLDLFSSFLSRLVSVGGGADNNLLSSAERVDPVGAVWITLIGALEVVLVELAEVFVPIELVEPPDNSINLKLTAQF